MRATALSETIYIFGIRLCDSEVPSSLDQLLATSVKQGWTNSTDGVVSEGKLTSVLCASRSDGLFISSRLQALPASTESRATMFFNL